MMPPESPSCTDTAKRTLNKLVSKNSVAFDMYYVLWTKYQQFMYKTGVYVFYLIYLFE